ncbi:MAG: hypothetical protein QOE96_2229 [Blastocatellia bacterium]|jgi:hypothetical protein|nr:hypothetical protein [Blastocatellia bacterium]
MSLPFQRVPEKLFETVTRINERRVDTSLK